MEVDEARKILQQKAAELAEYFEGVQILVSWMEGRDTHFGAEGSGNWYLRQGMARTWVESDTAETSAHKLRQVLPPPEDDGDGWKD